MPAFGAERVKPSPPPGKTSQHIGIIHKNKKLDFSLYILYGSCKEIDDVGAVTVAYQKTPGL